MKSFFKKALVFCLVMSVVAFGAWFGRKAYRKSAERRLTAQAAEYLDKKDFRNAALCLQRALQLNPMSIESNRMMADMLDAAGTPAALSWRIRTAQLEPDVTNRLAWAQTAIKLKDVRSAAEALRDIDEKSKATAGYQKLMGALAWSIGRADEAEKNYLEACRLEPGNAANVFNLNTIRLSSTNAETSRAARAALTGLAANPDLRIPVHRLLLADAISRKSLAEAFDHSRQLVGETSATFGDKVDHLALCRETKAGNCDSWRAMLEQEAATSPENAFILGRWIVKVDGVTNALRWLQGLPAATRTNQPVPLIITDCQIAMKDWKGLLELTQKQDWGEAEFYRVALESLCQRSLGQSLAAETSWRRAFRHAQHRVDRLSRLSQITAMWGWKAEQSEVLSEIVSEFPKESWAVDLKAAQLYSEGKTRELQELYAKVYSADPSNIRLKNNLASLFLLRKSDLASGHRMAQEAYEASSIDPFFVSTYAYSLFLQNRTPDALKVLEAIKPEHLRIPSVAAYYGVIQGESGHPEVAREPLKLAAASTLLPEEKEIVRVASAAIH